MKINKKTVIAVAICLFIPAAVFILKPADRGGGYGEYFTIINTVLKNGRIPRPVIVLDLDRVDSNIDILLQTIKMPLHYRVVVKSLPSPDMLLYIMNKTGSRRLMPFHLSHIRSILESAGPDVDMLPGRPFPVKAVEQFYESLPAGQRSGMLRSVQWLIDTDKRLTEYLAFASRRGIKLRVNIEIDVGLHRGGAKTDDELAGMLRIIESNPGRLVFSGFMGYDGHVTHVPIYIGSKESAIRKEFAKVMGRYGDFLEYGRKNFPALFTGVLTFNGGGSTTYSLYNSSFPVNDIAAGSCLVMPSTFHVFTLAGHKPALFIAAPILKKLKGFGVPFIEAFHGLVEWWDPNTEFSFYTTGGGWSSVFLAPEGISENRLTASPPNENMLPNQSLLNGSGSVELGVGDFVFYHPMQGDAIMQFNEIVILRDGRITGRWRPFESRI